MLKLFAADGTVKQEFPGAASVQYIGRLARLWSAKIVVAEVTLTDGETISAQARVPVPQIERADDGKGRTR